MYKNKETGILHIESHGYLVPMVHMKIDPVDYEKCGFMKATAANLKLFEKIGDVVASKRTAKKPNLSLY